jgi:hypothetical protein
MNPLHYERGWLKNQRPRTTLAVDTLASFRRSRERRAESSWFQGNPTGVVDAVQQKGNAILLEIFVTS